MRILVVQTAFIGDVVLTTPFLAALRARWPAAELHVVATPQGCEMLAGLEGVVCHSLDKKRQPLLQGFRQTLTSLGGARFDYVFAVHRSLRSLAFAKKAKAKKRIAFRSFWSRLFGFETVLYPPYSDGTHYADKPLALLARTGSVPPTPPPQLAVAPLDRARARERLARAGVQGAYAVVSPFSVWGTKMWFADRFARVGLEIFKKRGLPIVLIGGAQSSAERAVGQSMVEKIAAGGGRAASLVGETTIGELKAVIEQASLVVANDSAPVHVAAAFRVPTVAVFGPTARKWGFFPLSPKSTVVERPDVECRPCHIHGPPKCPRGHFRCMSEIQVEDVVKAVETLFT